jgi:hypothetical protein
MLNWSFHAAPLRLHKVTSAKLEWCELRAVHLYWTGFAPMDCCSMYCPTCCNAPVQQVFHGQSTAIACFQRCRLTCKCAVSVIPITDVVPTAADKSRKCSKCARLEMKQRDRSTVRFFTRVTGDLIAAMDDLTILTSRWQEVGLEGPPVELVQCQPGS